MSNTDASEQPINGPKCIEIPRGWSRILENGAILYISPNNSRLRSLEHVVEYLKTEGTCKCGLDCPLFVQDVFNFDARIPSKLIPVGTRPESSKSGCKHCVTDSSDAVNPKQSVDIGAKQSNDAKLPSISALGSKRGPGRPRNPLSKSRRVGGRKPDLDRPMSPLHNLPLPVPSSVLNSPVQSVPTNIALEQRSLPSFATIVSSSKLFNPGTSLRSNTILSSSVVTTATNSSPLTATSLYSSKSAITTSSIVVSSSSSSTNPPASAGLVITQASKTTAPVTSTVTVSQQHAATVTAQVPSRTSPEKPLAKSSSSPGIGLKSIPLVASAAVGQGQSKETSVSSSTTLIVTTSTTTIPAVKQDARLTASVSKVPDVKVTPKPAAPRSNKSSKPYSARKTVAATLKAAAAAAVGVKGSNASDVGRTGSDNSFPQTPAVTTTSTGPSSELSATKTVSKQLPQVLPLCTPGTSTTTVQAPALFHSVLKDAIIKEQSQLNRVVSSPSTNTPVAAITHAVPVHVPRAAQTSSTSSRSKSATPKETGQTTAALVQGVHVPPAVPQHTQVHRPQPQGTGHPLVNTASSFYSAVSLASSVSQQLNIQSSTVAQSTAYVAPTTASVFGQVQNTAASTQIPSLQLTASQGQGGVFFQGSGNQVFQMNVDSNQLKGTYQLHGALYQGAIPATFLATANASKAVTSNAAGGVPQALYQTNPYMLGIVMPTAITQSVSTQPAQSVATTATSPSATAVAAASVASYPYNNQNAAIAAAFESFVPIAPAAAPRFSQTLAHLASAYTPFMQRSAVQGSAPVQFAAQRMVPMSAMHSQASGNEQMAPAILNLADYTVKYPINTVKPGSYTSQVSTVSNVGSANTQPQTAVVAAMPYVAFGQINSPRFPFSVNFAAPGTSTNPSATTSSTSPSLNFVTSVTASHQHTLVSNTDSHGGGAVLGYVSMPVPFGTNISGVSHSQSAPTPHPGSAFSPPSSHVGASRGNKHVDSSVLSQHLPSWSSGTQNGSGAAAASQRRCSTPESSSSSSSNNSSNGSANLGYCSVTANSCTSGLVIPIRSSCMESSSSGTTLKSSSSNCSQSPRHPGVSSPLNSPLPLPLPNQAKTGSQGSIKSSSPLATVKSSVESMPVHSQTFSTFEGHQAKTSSEMASSLKRPYKDISEPAKKAKYDESAYYEANPLLGLKRSCEAIEAYCSPERVEENDHDDDDDEDDDDDDDEDLNDSAVPKNDQSSPVNKQAGEGILNSETYSKFKNCEQRDECSRANTSESQSKPGEVQPIRDQRQSHSVYNGDVSGNQNEGVHGPMMTQEPYRPVKTNPISRHTGEQQGYMDKPRIPNIRPQFEIGDIVWAQARGFPSWPGKVVDASEIGKGRPDDGKRWVMWFGEHTFSQVEVDRLKTLSEGLRTLDDKARKKKYKAKKTRIGLEQAISEALEALDMRERLRGRQAARSKTKKKRIR